MSRRRAVAALAVALVALALLLAACGGDDEEPATSPPPAEAPGGGAAQPSLGALPPGIAECLADQGVVLESPDDLHSAPQEVLNACFNALHQGGGAP
jgi:hypothetical protein